MMVAINACVMSVILFAVSSLGWSTSTNLTPIYAWSKAVGSRTQVSKQTVIGLATLTGNFQATQYVGLQGALVTLSAVGTTFATIVQPSGAILQLNYTFAQQTTFVSYTDSFACSTANCGVCQTSGRAVFVLVLMAASFSFFGIFVALFRFLYNKVYLRVAGAVLSFLALLVSAAAISSWHFNCILSSKQEGLLQNAKFSDFVGYNMAAGGFALAVIVFLIHLAAPHAISEDQSDEKAKPAFVEVTSFQA